MIRFLLKGLLRDRHRSFFPILTVCIGVALTVVMHCWMTGVFGDMIDFNARFVTGHVKVVTRAYADAIDQIPNDLALVEVESLAKTLRAEHPQMEWAPRIMFGGLLDVPDAQGETRAQATVMGWGVQLVGSASSGVDQAESRSTPEIDRLGIREALVQGRLPAAPGEILVSDDLARRLAINPGQRVTLIGATMNGGMAIVNFTLAGTVRFGSTALDRGAVIADFADVQRALDMEDAAGEILGFFAHNAYRQERAEAVCRTFNRGAAASGAEADEFAPMMLALRDQNDLGAMLDFSGAIMGVLIGVFVTAMSIVLWNAGLIGGIRRYGEIGVRLAIGESKPRVYVAMLAESVLIGLAGSGIGTLLGLGVGLILQYNGIDLGDQLKDSSMMVPSVFRAQVTPPAWIVGFLPGLLATVIGTSLAGIGIFRRNTAELFKELEA